MSDRQGVEIDYCPDCRGVWLDRGELDKILARSDRDDDDDDVPARRDDRDRDRDRHERSGSQSVPHRKKKKSFFSEIMEGFGGE
jgi:Zn-finger nucleic acid-binding protein